MGHVDREQSPDHPAEIILGHECGLCTIWKLCWLVSQQVMQLWHVKWLKMSSVTNLLQHVGGWTTCAPYMISTIEMQLVSPRLYESCWDMKAFCLPVAFWMTRQLLLGQEIWKCEFHRNLYAFLVCSISATCSVYHNPNCTLFMFFSLPD